MRTRTGLGLLLVGVAASAAAGELVLPIFALRWPGKDGNRWTSEVFLTNPGPATVRVGGPQLIPGILRTTVPCLPPVPAYRDVPPYRTVLLTPGDLLLDLGCPDAVLGGLAFDADGPLRISSRVVNDRGVGEFGGALAGLGQDVPAFAGGELAGPGIVWQIPGLVWHHNCWPPRFEIYLYFANPGDAPAEVTLQQSRDGHQGGMFVDGLSVITPYAFTVPGREFRQLKVDPPLVTSPAVCLAPEETDLFFTSTVAVAAVASVVDRASQDPWTVLPVRTSE